MAYERLIAKEWCAKLTVYVRGEEPFIFTGSENPSGYYNSTVGYVIDKDKKYMQIVLRESSPTFLNMENVIGYKAIQ